MTSSGKALMKIFFVSWVKRLLCLLHLKIILYFCFPYFVFRPQIMIGQAINNYTIERKIGDGGMGTAYYAKHNKVEREVAIKVLHRDLFDNETLRNRFKNEANALIKLNHPNIVQIYDYVEQDNFACLIMEYIDGVTLGNYISKKSGPLPASKITDIMCAVLDAVQFAHEHGIFHRDIKPDNIMIDNEGTKVKVMDFGIAKLSTGIDMKTTVASAQVGTPFYMSPEHVKRLTYTAQSDIYSLGVTLFEMATGKCPYIDTTNLFELQSKIVNEPLPPTDQFYPNVPKRIQNAIKIATHKLPERRFVSCLEFKKYLQGERITTRITLPSSIKVNAVGKSKKWIYFSAVLAIGIAATGVWFFLNRNVATEKQQSNFSIQQDGSKEATVQIKDRQESILQDSIYRQLKLQSLQMADSVILESERKINFTLNDTQKNILREMLSMNIITDKNAKVDEISSSFIDSVKTEQIELTVSFPSQSTVIKDLVNNMKKAPCGITFTKREQLSSIRAVQPSAKNQKISIKVFFTISDEESEEECSATIFYSLNKNVYYYSSIQFSK